MLSQQNHIYNIYIRSTVNKIQLKSDYHPYGDSRYKYIVESVTYLFFYISNNLI